MHNLQYLAVCPFSANVKEIWTSWDITRIIFPVSSDEGEPQSGESDLEQSDEKYKEEAHSESLS